MEIAFSLPTGVIGFQCVLRFKRAVNYWSALGIGWGSLIWGLFNGLFWAGSWVLRGLIWLAGKRRNLRLLEGLELIFGLRVEGLS